MFVFISYPRELEIFANQLAEELRERKISFFLDKESIGPERWRLRVEENVRKADIYVILYLPEAYIKGRYFYEELEHINEKGKQNNRKRIIPVTFSSLPLKKWLPYWFKNEISNKLPFFLDRHNAIDTDIAGVIQSEKDAYWISKIVKPIEDIRKKENQILKWLKIIAILCLFTIPLITCLLHYDDLLKLKDGKYICNSLTGNYKLDQEYTFIERNGTRSVANYHTTWKTASECIDDREHNQFILEGEDTTHFNVEIFFNQKYVVIAAIELVYPSEIFFDREGKLLSRKFNAITSSPKKITKYHYGKNKEITEKLTDQFIDYKIEEVMNYRHERHSEIRTRGCFPLRGLVGGKITLAFVCPDYTRVMQMVGKN